MKTPLRFLILGIPILFSVGCASRSEFVPESGPVTVGMPAELSDREHIYVGEVVSTLKGQGYLPVRHGAGEFRLDFRISEGPINSDTTLKLLDGKNVVAEGYGRGSGVPMIGRDKVADRSFQQAFGAFQTSLPAADAARLQAPPAGAADGEEYEYVY